MLISRIWSVATGGNKRNSPIYAILKPFEKKKRVCRRGATRRLLALGPRTKKVDAVREFTRYFTRCDQNCSPLNTETVMWGDARSYVSHLLLFPFRVARVTCWLALPDSPRYLLFRAHSCRGVKAWRQYLMA